MAKARVYDNGGTSFDRYTVVAGGDVFVMSYNPLSLQGMNQWAGKESDFEGLDGGVLLREDEIPPEIRKAVAVRQVQALAMEDYDHEGS